MSSTPATFSPSRRSYAPALLLFALVVLAYLPALRGGFIWDDDSHVTANRCVVGPLGFRDIWTSPEAEYFPLAVTNVWLQHKLWGVRPMPYHAVTLLLHACDALLLWWVLSRLKARGAWLGALLWGVHPMQTESVAWISEINSTQSALFLLASVWFFLNWIDPEEGSKGRRRDYLLSLGLGVLAILSKSTTVMLPVGLGLCWWWRGGWNWRRSLWLAPFCLVSGLFSVWTIWQQKVRTGAMGADWHHSLAERCIIAGRVIWFYLGKLAWPHPMMFFYPHWNIDGRQASAYAAPVLALLLLLVLWLGREGRLRAAFFAYAWFLVMLFPMMGFFDIFFFRYSYVAPHFQYLAGMGPLALAAAGLAWLGSKLKLKRSEAWTLAALPVLGCAAVSWNYSRSFHDDETLYRSALASNPDCWLAHNNLGVILADRPGRLSEAIAEYQACLRLRPGYAEAHNNLGNAFARLPGHMPEAIAEYRAALRDKSEFPEAHLDLGNALARYPRLRSAALQECEIALAQFETDPHLNPGLSKTHNSLGNLLADLPGRRDEAIAHYEAALRLDPDYAEAHYDLGLALSAVPGRRGEAIAHFESALRIRPGYVEARTSLGNAYLTEGGGEGAGEAVGAYEEALRLAPGYVPARFNLGLALLKEGRKEEAAEQFEAVLRLSPGNPSAERMLAGLRPAAK